MKDELGKERVVLVSEIALVDLVPNFPNFSCSLNKLVVENDFLIV